MNNPYFTTVGSYMQPVNPQEQQGLMPVFQNIAQQQQNQNAALAQQNQLVQQAGQTGQQGGGMNPMAMAMMLRKKDPNKPNYDQYQTSGDMTQFGSNSSGMGAGQGYSGMNADIGL
jgi:hypothetical protein